MFPHFFAENGVNGHIVDEPMEIGKLNGRILDVGGVEGIDAIAKSLGKQHDMRVHVIVNPQHERAQFVTLKYDRHSLHLSH